MCGGTFMRTHPKYDRVRAMLVSEEVPRTPDGGIQLCHLCQRALYFAGGFLPLLVKDLRRAAMNPNPRFPLGF